MQSFSREKCAGMHAFIYDFQSSLLVSVLPSSFWCLSFLSMEPENPEKTCMRFQHNSISARMATAIVVLAFDPHCYYGSFNAGS